MNAPAPPRRRVLVVLPASEFGGAERVAYNLVQGLEGYELLLLTQAALMVHFVPTGVAQQSFDEGGCHRPYDLSPGNAIRYARYLLSVYRTWRPDLVLAFMHNGTFFSALAACLGGWRVPLMGSIHGNVSAYFKRLGRAPSRWERFIIWLSVRLPQEVVVPSRGVMEDLRSVYRADPERLKLIGNGIDQPWVRSMAHKGAGLPIKQGPWVLSASRLSDQKDFACLLRAFRRVRQVMPAVLWIVGDGDQRADIEMKISEWGLSDSVFLVGFQQNPYAWMTRTDVLVLSSHYEGSPVSIIEGLTLGVPQVVTNCPSGPDELIDNGVNGFLVPVGDDSAMAERILELLRNADLRSRMGQAAQASSADLNLDTMLRDYAKSIDDVMTRGGRA